MHSSTLGPSDSGRSISHVSASSLQWQCGFAAYLMPEGTLSTSSVKLKHLSVSQAFSSIKKHLVRGFHTCCLIPVRLEVSISTRTGLTADGCEWRHQPGLKCTLVIKNTLTPFWKIFQRVCFLNEVLEMDLFKFFFILQSIHPRVSAQ